MKSRAEVPTYRPYQPDFKGKRDRIRKEIPERIRHQWFAIEPGAGIMTEEQCATIEKIFYEGKRPDHDLYNLSLSFFFCDKQGGRQVLLRVSGTLVRRVVFRLDAKTWCRLVAVSSKDSTDEREAEVHFFAP